MAYGRQREARKMLVAQAALMWSVASKAQVNEFIRSGHLETTSGAAEKPMPYDPGALRMLVESGAINGTSGH